MHDILLVDDNQDFLCLVKSLLENEGMTIQCAQSGEEALCALKGKTFHLMITDLNMPGLDGFALAQKASSIAPHMLIFMVTGDLSPGIPRLVEEAGIDMVLTKPFHPNEMLRAVRAVTGMQKESSVMEVNPKKPVT